MLCDCVRLASSFSFHYGWLIRDLDDSCYLRRFQFEIGDHRLPDCDRYAFSISVAKPGICART